MNREGLRVGIIGCGKIADLHAEALRWQQDCRLVAAYDAEQLMAMQFCERYDVENCCTDLEEFFGFLEGGVVHVTTPPQAHYELGMKALSAQCHVYMEKPFALNTREAENLICEAENKELKITVGHTTQFNPIAVRARQMIERGYLGGHPLHLESYYGYPLDDTSYAKALLGDKNHWVRKLPGNLLQNIISHGISKIAEYMKNEDPTVIAHGYTSSKLEEIEEKDIVDELRVIVDDCKKTTAIFTFSSQIRPSMHKFNIYGPKNSLSLDYDSQTIIKIGGERHKSYLEMFIPQLVFGKQYIQNSMYNIRSFAKRELHKDASIRLLINAFYNSIVHGAPLPIPYREILVTSRIMDKIFDQLAVRNEKNKPSDRCGR